MHAEEGLKKLKTRGEYKSNPMITASSQPWSPVAYLQSGGQILSGWVGIVDRRHTRGINAIPSKDLVVANQSGLVKAIGANGMSSSSLVIHEVNLLDSLSPHNVQYLLRSALVETSSRAPIADISLYIEHWRGQARVGLTGECGQRGVMIQAWEQGPDFIGDMGKDDGTVVVADWIMIGDNTSQ
jgi:hypothetical protein